MQDTIFEGRKVLLFSPPQLGGCQNSGEGVFLYLFPTCDPETGEWSFDEGGWADIASDNLAEADPDKDFGAPTYDKYPYGD